MTPATATESTHPPARLAARALVAALLVAAGTAAARADDWPQWLGPNRDGLSAETGWRAKFDDPNGPERLWQVEVGAGYCGPSVAAGRLYTLGNTADVDTILCLDASTGKEIWKYSYDCSATAPQLLIRLYGGPRATPTVVGGRLYSFSREGLLMCLSADDGKMIWQVDVRKKPLAAPIPTWGFACSPLMLGTNVLVDAGTVAAFDANTGKLAWKSRPYRAGYGSPVALSLAGKPCIATLNAKGLAVLDATDGTRRLFYPFSFLLMENCTTPIISGDSCFISAGIDNGSALVRLQADKAVEVRRGSEMMNLTTNSVLYEGHLYGFHGSAVGGKSLRCVELATGKIAWSYRRLREGALVIAGGRLIAIGGNGTLVLAEASPKGFDPLTTVKAIAPTCWTAPVLANGLLYLRNSRGDLVCLDLRAAAP